MTPPYPKALERFPHLRQSLLSSFDLCALQASFSMELEDGWSTHPQARGTIFHTVAKKAMQEMAAQGESQIDPDTAQALLIEALRQDDVDRVCPTAGCGLPVERKLHSRTVKAKGFKKGMPYIVCAKKHKHHSDLTNIPMKEVKDLWWTVTKWAYDNSWDIDFLVDVEQRLNTTIEYPDGHGGHVSRIITGQLDALFSDRDDETHAIVIDYKDTWSLPPETELSFEGYFQQRFYALLVMATYKGIQRVTTREQYVRRTETRSATIWRTDLPQIIEELSALVERFDRSVQEGVFAPTPGKACSYCPTPQKCPIPALGRREGRITTDEEAARVARQLAVSEALAKQAKAALSQWTSVHGPQPIKSAKANVAWGHKKSESVSRPTADKVQEEVDRARAEQRAPDIDKLYVRKVGSRFGQFEPTPEDYPDEVNEETLMEALKAAQAGS